MKGFVADIEERTLGNSDFRRVLYTSKEMQLVLMAILPGEEIGEEVHDDVSQFFRFEAGEGEVWIDGVCHPVKADDAAVIPAGARHNVKASGSEPLKLYTIYSPPEHIDGTIHRTCAEAQAAHEHWDGRTSE
jgi:mannose-6-phosphate isomerase-like protein (cupin superfamily)